ncbi:MAG TPA: hypothetical protein VI230_04415, partial [Ignavibacteriaceae bacterium]
FPISEKASTAYGIFSSTRILNIADSLYGVSVILIINFITTKIIQMILLKLSPIALCCLKNYWSPATPGNLSELNIVF